MVNLPQQNSTLPGGWDPEAEQHALNRLDRVHGEQELHAAILALLLPRRSRRAVRAWRAETEGNDHASGVREAVMLLGGTARLPCLETLLKRMAIQPISARRDLLAAMRRIMSARGSVRPIDRLHWLSARQILGDAPVSGPREVPMSGGKLAWESDQVRDIARFSAYLSRMVPNDERGKTYDSETAAAWFAAAMAFWAEDSGPISWEAVDAEGLVNAWHGLQQLTWMQRPMVVRGWVESARRHSRYGHLTYSAADALRLSCNLLECPMPPELAHHYRPRT
jgi:hypothetical protein